MPKELPWLILKHSTYGLLQFLMNIHPLCENLMCYVMHGFFQNHMFPTQKAQTVTLLWPCFNDGSTCLSDKKVLSWGGYVNLTLHWVSLHNTYQLHLNKDKSQFINVPNVV